MSSSSSLDCLELCRLCLEKERVSVPIFENEGDVRQIFLKITACLPVKVSRDDKLPKKICDDCLYKVELFYQFWNTTANAEKQLLQWLGEVGGLEDGVPEVLVSNVMKQEQASDSRLEGRVVQVGGQNSVDMGMIENMTIITMPVDGEQQFASVPMDTSGTVTVQAVASSSASANDQSQTSVSHLADEVEDDDDDDDDDGCDNEGMPVKEENEEDQSDRVLDQSSFVTIPCDEAGPSGLQQKIADISNMSLQPTEVNDPKTGCPPDLPTAVTQGYEEILVQTARGLDQGSEPMYQTLYQVTYVDGEPRFAPITDYQPDSSEDNISLSCNDFVCEECGLIFPSVKRLQAHRSTHDPLKRTKKIYRKGLVQRKKQRIQKALEELEQRKQQMIVVKSRKPGSEANDESGIVLSFVCPKCGFRTVDRTFMLDHFNMPGGCKPKLDKDEVTLKKELEEVEEEGQDVVADDEVKVKNEEEMVVVGNIERDEDAEYNLQDENNGNEEKEEDEQQPQEDTVEFLEDDFNVVETEYEEVHYICSDCGFLGYSQDDIDFHECEDAKPKMMSCHACTFECTTQGGLQNHIARKHKDLIDKEPLECEECGFTSVNKNTMYSHKRKHRLARFENDDSSLFGCEECSFTTKSENALIIHVNKNHREPATFTQLQPNLYQCDQCDYQSKNRYEMKVHFTRKHTDAWNYECEECGKKYKIKGDLTNHIRFQHREQPIICDVCGKTCGNSNSLYVHQKFAHYKAEFECPVCHRRMVSQANLDEHILKQHETREDAVCDECGKTFPKQSRLKIHMRVHTGLKPFACKICGKAFARKTALRQHLLIHSGQRPYVCDICGKTFTQKPGLISHRKSHPGSHPPLPVVRIEHLVSDMLSNQE